jgi:hypothetical protein
MKKQFINIWRVFVFVIAVTLFTNLFAAANTTNDSVRIGRTIVPHDYLYSVEVLPQKETTQLLTYK